MRLGKPRTNPEVYEQVRVGDITVYVKPSLAGIFASLTVELEKLFFIKYLGAKAKKRI